MTLPFLKLAHLRIDRQITDDTGRPSREFTRYFNDIITNIQTSANQHAAEINLIETALTNAGIALSTANAAKSTAQGTAKQQSLTQSYVDPGSLLVAAISPANPAKAKITIAAHTRHYGDGTMVSVNAGSIDLLDLDAYYYVFYDDAVRAGGAVSYDCSLNYLTAAQLDPRHAVGGVQTPASGGSPSYGEGTRPPGTGGYKPGENIP